MLAHAYPRNLERHVDLRLNEKSAKSLHARVQLHNARVGSIGGHKLELVIWISDDWVNCVGGNSAMIFFATSHFDITTITPLIGP